MNNKKKLLIGSLSTAAVVAGVAMTGGTSAYYYDLERSEGNRLSACSIDLEETGVTVVQTAFGDEDSMASQVDTDLIDNDTPGNSGALSTITLDNLLPGDAFTVDIALKNSGNCSGEMWGDINFPIDDNENGILEPEAPYDTTDGNKHNPQVSDGHVGGELDDVITVVYGGDDAGNVFNGGTYHDLAFLPPYLMDGDFAKDEVNHVVLTLTVPDDQTAGNGNEIMGDSFTFAVDFAAAQKNKLQPRNGGSGLDLNNPATLNNS